MFRIREVHDGRTVANRAAIDQVQRILREQFPLLDASDVAKLPDQLVDPLTFRFRSILLVAEDAHERVRGFALVLHAPDLGFAYLDYVSSAAGKTGKGIGGALYERVRETAAELDVVGVFLECLPDDPELCRDPKVLAQNRARLKFYERYGARPIANTAYETPVKPGDDNPPYLVFDDLGSGIPLRRERARRIVRAILERKYADLCPAEYIDHVVRSFRDDPVVLRASRYIKNQGVAPVAVASRGATPIPLVVNDRHQIHHVRERGYVESPVRIPAVLKALEPTGLFERIEPHAFPESHIRAVHDGGFVDYLARACAAVEPDKSIYPYVFPLRNAARPPKDLPIRAGYYCIDTFTPLNGNAYVAARRAVDCTLTAAETIVAGRRLAYSLVRPPGHHAERRVFGGFCYFNSAAVAANFLARYGRVCVLDIDYHHGNGTQDIFYARADVLTISIHGHPRFAYPYFAGFADEQGDGEGIGYNLNLPLPEEVDGAKYRIALAAACRRIREFDPNYLVVAAGFDTAAGDPTGTWSLAPEDMAADAEMIAALDRPTLVVQEGGYNTRRLGINVRSFFQGFVRGVEGASERRAAARVATRQRPPSIERQPMRLRHAVRTSDQSSVRALTAACGVFNAEEIEVAVELVRERLLRGPASGYFFVMADRGPQTIGYACFGPIPGAAGSYDLYWIVVRPDLQGTGIGRRLLAACEQAIRDGGGRRIYVDTSSRSDYDATRGFYAANGYREEARLDEFYAPGDAKVIFVKHLPSE